MNREHKYNHPCAFDGCEKMVSRKATYCGHHCRRNNPNPRQRIEKQCEHCSKTFYPKPFQVAKGQGLYCSARCAYAARAGKNSPFWNGGKETRQCEQCGVTVERTPAFFRGRKHIYCSISCKAIWQKLHQPRQDTDIERIMRDALAAAGLSFQEQVPLCKVSIADFYDPIRQVAVFCDGDYWHNLPKHIEQDKRQTAILKSAGIIVLRFWGREIKSNIGACINQIADALSAPPVQFPLPIDVE